MIFKQFFCVSAFSELLTKIKFIFRVIDVGMAGVSTGLILRASSKNRTCLVSLVKEILFCTEKNRIEDP